MILNQDSDDLILMDMYLRNAGFETILLSESSEMMSVIEKTKPNLVLLHVGLTPKDGYELCEEIRRVSSIPIILMNQPCEEWEVVKGFDSGADDYVLKPIRPAELIARIQSLFRREQMFEVEQKRHIYRLGELVIYLLDRDVFLGEKKLTLSNREFDLLVYFMQHAGEELSKEVLLDEVWQGEKVLVRTLDIYVQKLRRKLEAPHLIETIWGYGYRFLIPMGK